MASSDNYMYDAMKAGYELVTSGDLKWPKGFTNEMKVVLLQGFVEYWEECQEYEMCSQLKIMIEALQNEEDSSTSR